MVTGFCGFVLLVLGAFCEFCVCLRLMLFVFCLVISVVLDCCLAVAFAFCKFGILLVVTVVALGWVLLLSFAFALCLWLSDFVICRLVCFVF